MSNDNIEQIFKSAETEKNIPLSTGAWNRMDDLLQKEKSKPSIFNFRFMSIAASFLVLVSAFFIINQNSDSDYILEQLVVDKGEIVYSTSEVAQLNHEHQLFTLQRLRPFYNEDGEVKATVN